MKLSGAVAVVTGGGQGIGAAVARALAREGAKVIVAARTKERIDALAAEIEGKAVQCDVTDAASVRDLAQAAGAVDILVNNAGAAHSARCSGSRSRTGIACSP